jgi:Flp pilus assembly protein TadB
MAKRKRRKAAGPPPAHSPRREALAAPGAPEAKPKRRQGEPVQSGMRAIALRAGIVAAIFYPYLIYVVGESPAIAFVISILAFGLMLPLGILIDRFRYRRQMRKFEERRAERSPGRR